MEILEYVNQKKILQEHLLTFIENESDDNEDYEKLTKIFEKQNISNNRDEFLSFLYLLIKIIDNHKRTKNFFKKIEQILLYFQEDIKEKFTNTEKIEIFKSNNRIFLFLINTELIASDETFFDFFDKYDYLIEPGKFHYFYPEIKKLFDSETRKMIEKDILKQDPDIFENFDKKRQKAENDTYIAELIREDLIDEFIMYVNQTNYPLNNRIKHSIFETNAFLIEDKEPTLIEYSAFFGSIQIFQYLRLNKVKIRQSLMLYAIHGNNADMIHLLEENGVKFDERCLRESIKCHHKEITNYIQNNLNSKKLKIEKDFDDNVILYCFQNCNYEFFPDDLFSYYVLFYSCSFNYINLLKLLLKENKLDINHTIISIVQFS